MMICIQVLVCINFVVIKLCIQVLANDLPPSLGYKQGRHDSCMTVNMHTAMGLDYLLRTIALF
jgi:hypothetical protein